MFDSASKKIVVDGVEYVPYQEPVESLQEPENAPVDAPVGNVEPWYAFIKATRFWVMILGALSVYGEAKGWIGEPERNFLATVSAIFITVSTFDRGTEQMSSK